MTSFQKIAIAPNAFKGTLTAAQAADCIERGLRRALPHVEFLKIPVADGGDGTADAIIHATGGRLIPQKVHDPLGRPLTAHWGLTGDKSTAIIEMARASGLALLTPAQRNPMKTSTRGTGDLIRSALDHGVNKILIGIGGGATTDAATGIARALGIRFLDARGRDLPEGGAALLHLAHIDISHLDPRLANTSLEVACDVDNPLFGSRGAAHVYGPQKGATPAMVKTLDGALRHLAKIIRKDLGKNIAHLPGAGAAGGSGAGLVAFLNARLRPGSAIVMDAVHLRQKLQDCDLVFTGEGRLDSQTLHGKAPAAVAQIAKSLRIHTIALCGSVADDLGSASHASVLFDAVFSTIRENTHETDLKPRAAARLEQAAHQIARLLAL